MNYLIIDKTANTGNEFIGDFGDNCNLEENAAVYSSEERVIEVIKENDWEKWAITRPTDYLVNQ